MPNWFAIRRAQSKKITAVVTVLALVGLSLSLALAPVQPAAASGDGQTYYGSPQTLDGEQCYVGTYTVPADVTYVHIKAIGQVGEEGYSEGFTGGTGGAGGYVDAIVPVTPGEVLYAAPTSSLAMQWGATAAGGSGGHPSFVSSVDPTGACNASNPGALPASSLLVVAAGGGGGGSGIEGTGGAGGAAGGAGVPGGHNDAVDGGPGAPGTQSGGGAGGAAGHSGSSHAADPGGNGAYISGGNLGDDEAGTTAGSGGGGGGGYYGGGGGGGGYGGGSGGGGGGSNYVQTGVPTTPPSSNGDFGTNWAGTFANTSEAVTTPTIVIAPVLTTSGTVTMSPDPGFSGSTATLTATFRDQDGDLVPDGTVAFTFGTFSGGGSTSLGTATISHGVASVTTTVLPETDDVVVAASYSGFTNDSVYDLPSEAGSSKLVIGAPAAPPTITTQPLTTVATYGDVFPLIAGASANPAATVQWQKSPDNVSADFVNVTGTWGDVYDPDTSAIDSTGKWYRAVYTNMGGSVTTNAVKVTVVPSPLTITADDKSISFGSGAPAYTVTYSTTDPKAQTTFKGTDTAATLSGTLTCGTTPTDTSTLAIGDHAINCSGLSSPKYSITYVAGTLGVKANSQTIHFSSTPTTTVAGNTYQVTATGGASGKPVVFTLDPSSDPSWCSMNASGLVTFTAVYADLGQGTCVIDANEAGNATYPAAPTVQQVLTVSASPPVITNAPQDVTVDYGHNAVFYSTASGIPTPVLQWNYSTTRGSSYSFPNDDGFGNLVLTTPHVSDSGAWVRASYYNAGVQAFFATSDWAHLTVNPVPLTIKPSSATLNYGSTTPTVTFDYTGFVNGDGASSLATQPTCTTTLTATTPPGTYPNAITCSGAVDSDYTIGYETGPATVIADPLTIAATDVGITYGEATPALTPSYDGFANSEGPSDLDGTVTCSTDPIDGVGQYTISCAGATSADYTITYSTATLTVATAPLTITAEAVPYHYGDNTVSVSPGYDGFVNGDTAGSLSTSPTCVIDSDYLASLNSGFGDYGDIATCFGAVDPNYDISYVAGDLTSSPAPLTIAARSYEITYGDSLPDVTADYDGLVNGDLAPTPASHPRFSGTLTCSTGPVHDAGSYPITCSGIGSSFYLITYQAGTLVVDPAPLLVVASDGESTYGGAAPTITPSYTGLTNGDSAPTVAPTCVANTDAHTAAGIHASISTCSGASDGNYAISYLAGTVTVDPAALKVTASNGTNVYGSPAPHITADYSGFVNGDGTGALTAAPICSTSTSAITPAGAHPDTANCSGLVDSNYVVSYVPGAVNVTAAPVIVTASSGTSVYGSLPPTVTASYAGLVNNENEAVFSSQPTCATTVTASAGVGDYSGAASCSGAVDPNYTFSYLTGNDSVTVAALTITASDGESIYGDDAPTITPSYDGLVNGDLAPTIAPICDSNTDALTAASTYLDMSTCVNAVDDNYAISYLPGTVTIDRAPLQVTASDGTNVYGSSAPLITAGYSGFVNHEDAGTFTDLPLCSTSTSAATPVGVYADVTGCSGAVDPNYDFSYIPGGVTVTAAPIVVTASSDSSIYGSPAPTVTASLSGFVNDETDAVLSSAPTCGTTVTPVTSVGTYSGAATCAGADAANYSFSYVAGDDAVTLALLTITASSSHSVYGAAPAAIIPSYSGFENSDSAATLSTEPTCTTIVTATTDAGTYAGGATCAGAADSNYQIAYVASDAIVTKAPLKVSVDSQSRAFDSPNAPFAASYSGMVNGDSVASLGTLVFTTNATQSSDPGTYAVTASGLVSNDYSVTYIAGLLTVGAKPLADTAPVPESASDGTGSASGGSKSGGTGSKSAGGGASTTGAAHQLAGANLTWLWILLGIVALLVAAGIVVLVRRRPQ
ncbi:MAG TPA: MBG domain-containing protein [Galbitalea sp.]|jgi:hypothetical protein|nr:MBG domain-containing protein [Galbitalea sp.]